MLAPHAVLADCDVDAADLHLLLTPQVREQHTFSAGHVAQIRTADCIACGACLAHCRFDAVQMQGTAARDARFSIDPIACEGCGVYVRFCPVPAVEFSERVCGEWMISKTRCGPLVHAQLGAGAGNSGRLVLQVRAAALRSAALIGGLHPLHANNERPVAARAALRRYDPARIIPCHCKGKAAVRELQAAFPGRVTPGYAGLRYAVNARKST